MAAGMGGVAGAELIALLAGHTSARDPNPLLVLVATGLTTMVALGGSMPRRSPSPPRVRPRAEARPVAAGAGNSDCAEPEALVQATVAALAETLRRRDAGPAMPLAVHVGDEQVEVFWDRPPPVPPKLFRASSTGWLWTTELERLAAAPGEREAEVWMPTLVPAGATGLGELWLHLEGFGLLNLVGDAAHAEVAQRHLVAAVTSPLVDVMVVGAPSDDPAPFGVGVAWVTLEQAVMEVRRRRARLRRELEDRAWTSVLTARLRDAGGASWRPLVLAVTDDEKDPNALDALARLAHGGRTGTACLVMNREPDGESTPIVCGAGVLHLPVLGGIAVSFGACKRDESTKQDDSRSPSEAGAVEVRVLGPVDVVGGRSALGGKALELVAYLACYPDGVSDDRIKTVLWPSRAVRHESWLNRLSAARQALGTDSRGEWLLPYVEDGVSRLDATVTTDVDAIEGALRESEHAPADSALGLLRTALERVRGRPFDERAGYEWAFGELHVARAERVVGDVAHRLAELSLDAGDWRSALWAAEQGLVAVPASEPLARDRMRAFAAAGDVRGVRRALRDLLAALEVPDEPAVISPETRELYEQLCSPSSSVGGWPTTAGDGSGDRPADR